jgi:hypothetical protein
MEHEEWRWIEGYEGDYQVSDKGRVASYCARTRHKPVYMKARLSNSGYKQVQLGRKIGKPHYIHRLVALAFVAGYRDGLCVNHKDLNRNNNHASNLEWTTHRENLQHARDNGHSPSRLNVVRGSKHHKAKLTEADVLYIRDNYRPRDPAFGQKAMCQKFGIGPSMMTYIIQRQYWTHI